METTPTHTCQASETLLERFLPYTYLPDKGHHTAKNSKTKKFCRLVDVKFQTEGAQKAGPLRPSLTCIQYYVV
eukprot:scaffold377258_cov73-Cyclotella_meneghiniana.AAC.2